MTTNLLSFPAQGIVLLDGAAGSNYFKMGMAPGTVTELWADQHPDAVQSLQMSYVQAGCQVLYAPTLQAQPEALARCGMAEQTEALNARLVERTRRAAQGKALVAGDLSTMAGVLPSWDPANLSRMVQGYRRQIRGLLDGGADLLAAETLLYPLEAEAIREAAAQEGAGAVLYTFTLGPDGRLIQGQEAGPVLAELERSGAAAVGINCVPVCAQLPTWVRLLRREVRGPLVCKPNAGMPEVSPGGRAVYPTGIAEFVQVQLQAADAGATLLGGCCGTDPGYLQALASALADAGRPGVQNCH